MTHTVLINRLIQVTHAHLDYVRDLELVQLQEFSSYFFLLLPIKELNQGPHEWDALGRNDFLGCIYLLSRWSLNAAHSTGNLITGWGHSSRMLWQNPTSCFSYFVSSGWSVAQGWWTTMQLLSTREPLKLSDIITPSFSAQSTCNHKQFRQ